MTCEAITNVILRNRWRQAFAIPRYTPDKWFEADVFERTKAGYFREYEIKTSRVDFLRDAKKENSETWRGPTGSKHKRLAAKDVRGPVQFWFVVPEGLIRLNEVPEWAGLIEITQQSPRHHLYEVERIKAPRLHGEKCAQAVNDHSLGICYYRFTGMLALKDTAKKQMNLLRAYGWPKIKPPETGQEAKAI